MIKKIAVFLFVLVIFILSCHASPKFSTEKTNYILKEYEVTMLGKQHLFYPAKQAKRLLIFFNGARKNKYIMWSWFWNDKEIWTDTAYLFLKDDDICWYLGNNEKSFIQDYSNIINHYINVCKLTKDKVFTIGGSMGGYAAIFYATLLGLKGAIALNPQVNKINNDTTRFFIQNTGDKWQDLDVVIRTYPVIPNISLIFGAYPSDQAACYALIDEAKHKTPLLIIRRHPSTHHSGGVGFSREFVES